MKRISCVVSILALILLLALPGGRAEAQRAMQNYSHTFGLGIWFASGNLTEPGGTGTWRTTFWILDYRIRPEDALWGFRFRYGTGGQGSWAGTFSGASGGRDTLWSADVSYRFLQPRGINVWGFIGYGSTSFESTLPAPTGTPRVTSSGFRIGADVEIPLQQMAARGDWSIIGSLAWSPSNSVTSLSGGTTTTSSGAMTEWSVALRIPLWSAGTVKSASSDDFQPAFSTRLGGHDFGGFGQLGWRSKSGSGASNFGWSGPFVSLTYTF